MILVCLQSVFDFDLLKSFITRADFRWVIWARKCVLGILAWVGPSGDSDTG